MTINLIPPKIKKEKELIKIASLSLSALFVIILLLIVFSGTVYLSDNLVKANLTDIEKQISEQDSSLLTLEPTQKKIDLINSKLEKIDATTAARPIWSNIIKDLASDTPQNLKINTLSMDANTGKIDLTGITETRRDIAAFKEKLEASKFFKNVTFSTSSLAAETSSYSFSLSCELENKK